MAKGSRGGRRTHSATTNVQPTTAQPMTNAVVNATTFDDNDAQLLVDEMDDVYTDPDFVDARKLYIANNNPNGDGFSISQNLNYKLDNGMALDANEKFVDNNIQFGMHNLGKDSNLVRYAHDDILQGLGISDYTKMTDAQLQKALVGTTFTTTSYMSTSYNGKKSPFNPSAPDGGGREVLMNVKTGKNTKVIFGNQKQTEIVINKGTNFKVTGIHYDGTMAYPRKKGARPRVVLDIETI